MCAYEADFVIVRDKGCPIYTVNERFNISGQRLFIPKNKPTCILLVRDITQIIIQALNNSGRNPRKRQEESYSCSGCSGGLINFVEDVKKPSASSKAHIMTEAERREQASVMGAITNMLSTFTFFQALDEDSLQDIISALTVDSFKVGEIILRRGEEGKKLYIIVSGRVEILDDKDVGFTFLDRGEIFGEMSLLSGNPVNATVRAVQPLKALVLNRVDLDNLLLQHPNLQEIFTSLIVKRLSTSKSEKPSEVDAGMAGKLTDIPASELFQMFHDNAKTGQIVLNLAKGDAALLFLNGEIVKATYHGLQGLEAFFDILREKDGRFRFIAEMPAGETPTEPIGGFMKILMEGLRLIDEEHSDPLEFVE